MHGGVTSPKEADEHFRGVSGKAWREATAAERKGIYGYTASSGAWNRPLSGFRKPYSKPGTGWEKKFYVGTGDVWIDYEGKGAAIRNMTSLIEKSTYDHDAWGRARMRLQCHGVVLRHKRVGIGGYEYR